MARDPAAVLVLAFEEDTIFPLDSAQAMVAAMPEAELLVLSGAGHGAPLTHPREIASALIGFFKGRPAVRANASFTAYGLG